MERVKEEGKLKWRKVGGGSLRIGKRIIKPGETFLAYPEEISNAFRKLVEPVDGSVVWDTKKDEAPPVYPITKVSYTVEPSAKIEPRGKNNLWWNVVDKDGNVLNEKALKKEDAEAQVTFNLVGTNGKVINEKPLSKEDAETLLTALEK